MSRYHHTPPVFSLGSLNPMTKRARSGSISKRLRNAAELCQDAQVDPEAQGALKDIIIRDDPQLQQAMRRIEEGDKDILREMLADGVLSGTRKNSIDVMGDYGDLNFEFLNVNENPPTGSLGGASIKDAFVDMNDDDENEGSEDFEFAFDMAGSAGGLPPRAPGSSSNRSLSSPSSRAIKMESGSARRSSGPSSGGNGAVRVSTRGATRSASAAATQNQDTNTASSSAGSRRGAAADPQPIMNMRVRDNTHPRSGSFGLGQQMGDLFDFQLFDDAPPSSLGTGANELSYSPMTGSHQSTDGTGSTVRARLHRDSIAQLDDLLFSADKVGSYSSIPGSLDDPRNPAGSRPMAIPGKPPKGGAGRATKPKKSNAKPKPKPKKASDGMKKTKAAQAKAKAEAAAEKERKAAAAAAAAKPASPPKMSAAQARELAASVTPASGYVGGYSPDSRQRRIEKFLQKRHNRVWMKRVKYDVRKNFADSRLRVKGRFVKKEDEEVLRELIIMTM